MSLLFYYDFYINSTNDEIRWSEIPKSLKSANGGLQLNIHFTLTFFSFFKFFTVGINLATSSKILDSWMCSIRFLFFPSLPELYNSYTPSDYHQKWILSHWVKWLPLQYQPKFNLSKHSFPCVFPPELGCSMTWMSCTIMAVLILSDLDTFLHQPISFCGKRLHSQALTTGPLPLLTGANNWPSLSLLRSYATPGYFPEVIHNWPLIVAQKAVSQSRSVIGQEWKIRVKSVPLWFWVLSARVSVTLMTATVHWVT